jgi:hypothetical protein
VERAECYEKGTEECGPAPDQAPSDQIERRDGKHPKYCGQQPESKLVERYEWADQVMIEEIQKRPRIAETGIQGVPQHEDLVAVETPVGKTPEAKRYSKDGQGGDDYDSREPVTLLRGLGSNVTRGVLLPEY